MPWISLSLQTDDIHAEVLSEALLELGALSTDVHDAAAGTEREQLLFDEPGEFSGDIWRAAELTALFEAGADIPSIIQVATQAAGLSDPPSYRVEFVEEQDWIRVTQSQFNPIHVSPRLWIVPSWHQIPDSNAINLIIDPGLAFGTGAHPSTQLCLEWLDENLRWGEDVLDYGCGSGILAIAAAKLGARHVVGIDIDPQAVEASRQNARLNHCEETKVEFHAAQTVRRLGVESQCTVDVVVANILANPLIILAPILGDAVRKGGHIVLSGILLEQAEDVMQAYRQRFDIRIARQRDGWGLLEGTRK